MAEEKESDDESVLSLSLSQIEERDYSQQKLSRKAGSALGLGSSMIRLNSPFSASQGRLPVELAHRGSAVSFKSVGSFTEEKEVSREHGSASAVFRQDSQPKKRSKSILQQQLLTRVENGNDGAISTQRLSSSASGTWLSENRKLSIFKKLHGAENEGENVPKRKKGSGTGKNKLSDYLKTRTKRNKEKATLRGISRTAQKVHQLPRGGVYVRTSIGAIQFGCPPETIKDSLNMGLDTPMIYVLPKERFNMTVGVNVAELEFPTYYNYFIKQRRITLVAERKTQTDVHAIFQESLYGPEHKYLYSEREFEHCPPRLKESRPDHALELTYFGSYRAEEGSETVQLSQDKLIRYCFYDEAGYSLVDNEEGQEVVIYDNKDKFCFEVFDYNAYRKSLEKERKEGAEKWTQASLEQSPVQAFQMAKGPGYEHLMQLVTYDDAEQCGLNWNDQYHVGISNDDDEEDEDVDSETETKSKQNGNGNAGTESTCKEKKFTTPDFGLTILGNSHGFDPKGTTTGFVVWVNGKGIMVDPPPHSSQFLIAHGIQPKTITAIILSHCHADHDAGTFQKMITEHKVELLTSATVFESFKRKYSAISNLTPEFIERLVNWRPIFLEEPNYWNGAQIRFFYSLHSIPCIGFEAKLNGKSIVYSADTLYNEKEFKRLRDSGVLSPGRMQSLMNFPWHADVVLHESGVPPIHTTLEQLSALPEHKKKNIYLVHIDGNSAQEAMKNKFKVAKPGLANTIVLQAAAGEYTTKKLLQIISSMEIFEHISVSKALELVLMAQPVKYNAGQMVVNEEEPHSRFIIIISGTAAVKFGSLKRFLFEGDYFGELMFLQDKEIDEEEFEAEYVRAEIDLHTLELDRYALRNLMLDDTELQIKMEISIKARIAGCWEAIESNEMLSTLSASQKNVLQSLLDQQKLKKGEILSITDEDFAGNRSVYSWERGAEVAFAVLILRGSLTFDEVHGVGEQQQNSSIPPLSTGMLLYDYRSSVSDKKLKHTLRAASDDAEVFTIRGDLFDRFLEMNPLVLLGLFHSEVLP